MRIVPLRKNMGKYPFDEKTTNIEDRLWGAEVIKNGYHISLHTRKCLPLPRNKPKWKT